MTIQAVVFDIGGILEITPSLAVTERWESRLGLEAGEINKRTADVWYGGSIGTISEADVLRALAERFGFDERQVDEFMGWFWREYLGSACLPYLSGRTGATPLPGSSRGELGTAGVRLTSCRDDRERA